MSLPAGPGPPGWRPGFLQFPLASGQLGEDRVQRQPLVFRGLVLPRQLGDLGLQPIRQGLALFDFRCRPAGTDRQTHVRFGHVPIGGPQLVGVRLRLFSAGGRQRSGP